MNHVTLHLEEEDDEDDEDEEWDEEYKLGHMSRELSSGSGCTNSSSYPYFLWPIE